MAGGVNTWVEAMNGGAIDKNGQNCTQRADNVQSPSGANVISMSFAADAINNRIFNFSRSREFLYSGQGIAAAARIDPTAVLTSNDPANEYAQSMVNGFLEAGVFNAPEIRIRSSTAVGLNSLTISNVSWGPDTLQVNTKDVTFYQSAEWMINTIGVITSKGFVFMKCNGLFIWVPKTIDLKLDFVFGADITTLYSGVMNG